MALETAEMAEVVRHALLELSPDYEQLLTARYLDEVSVDEIAAQDRTTAAAVRSKLARARAALRDILMSYSCFDREQI